MSRAAVRSARDGYTGGLFERDVVGKCRYAGTMQYVPFRQAMEEVKKLQPWDPSDPELPTANDLHASIATELRLDDWSELKLFTAVGSPLDQFHSIDAFVEFRGKVVTIDLTVSRFKGEYRADITVDPDDIFVGMSGTAKKIAEILFHKRFGEIEW